MSRLVKFLLGLSLFLSPNTWREIKESGASKRRVFFGLLLYATDKGFRNTVQHKMSQIKAGTNETIKSGENVVAVLVPNQRPDRRRITNAIS